MARIGAPIHHDLILKTSFSVKLTATALKMLMTAESARVAMMDLPKRATGRVWRYTESERFQYAPFWK